jgi:hypothetical protein
MALERAARARADDVAFAIGRLGRRARTHGDHRELRHGIEQAQRFIVRDVLLRLSGFDEGEREIGGDGHAELPLRLHSVIRDGASQASAGPGIQTRDRRLMNCARIPGLARQVARARAGRGPEMTG